MGDEPVLFFIFLFRKHISYTKDKKMLHAIFLLNLLGPGATYMGAGRPKLEVIMSMSSWHTQNEPFGRIHLSYCASFSSVCVCVCVFNQIKFSPPCEGT